MRHNQIKAFRIPGIPKIKTTTLKINSAFACSMVGSSHISREEEGINILSLQVGRQVTTLCSTPANVIQGGRRGGYSDG